MKIIFILLFLFSNTLFANDIAMETFKNNKKIKAFLADKPTDQYWINYHQMPLGGECGFTGCHWRELISLVVTAKSANAPSTTIIALIDGNEPKETSTVNIKFVKLTEIKTNIH
jgi:hypothetical protein